MTTNIEPVKTVFLVAPVNNDDGTIDFEWTTPAVFETEQEAVAHMKEEADPDSHGNGGDMPSVVYRMVPIWRTVRKYKVIHLEKK